MRAARTRPGYRHDEPQPPALLIEGLSLSHGQRPILRDAALRLEAGHLAILTGPNGHGKTTFFRAVMGLQAVTAGTISFAGRPSSLQRDIIGYLPQGRKIPAPQLSARDHIVASWRGRFLGPVNTTKSCHEDVDRVCAMVGAQSFVHRPLGQLSGGEKQRIFLAIALLGSPKFLLLDEPMSAVDPEGQSQFVRLLSHLCRTFELTVLLSAHNVAVFKPLDPLIIRLTNYKLERSDAGF